MPDSRALRVNRSQTPDTVLDGVDWPGPTLLLAGVALLAWTVSGLDDGGRLLAGAVGTMATVIVGIVWITVEHLRFRARQDEDSG
ncbi:hypothetical protein JMUB6875_40000 [Nocardia sp. JMUB6875]|uniref:hypothetical protein n=1 Tax=Nocardia sp. JMUB6875 TaxID=3158170 RepID=UPI0032E7D35C